AAVGLLLGRIGCFLNGCCYGEVACPHCPAVHFPLAAEARYDYAAAGYQTDAGFILKDYHTVEAVEPDSPAYRSGLRPGDEILKLDNHPLRNDRDWAYLTSQSAWPRGKND